MNYVYTILKVVALAFVPIPVNPCVTRTDKPNTWTLTCDGFTSLFQEAKVFWKTPAIEELLGKSQTILNAYSTAPTAPDTPPPTPARRRSIRPGEGGGRSD
jgi:hypothetical protein